MAKKVTKKAAKKAPAKKAPAKKVVAKKAPAKKAPTKAAPVKKAAAKKAPTKTTPAKKVVAKKVVAKKAPAKKVAVKKVSVKKTPAKKVETTSILARVDVGFGNNLYIRGEGAGLSWEKGTIMENVSPYEWSFKSTVAKGTVVFKFLINDEVWSTAEDLSVAAGGTSISTPSF